MKEFRLKKKVNSFVWDFVWSSLKLSITCSVNKSHSTSVMYSIASYTWNSQLSVWILVRNSVQWSFEQK